MLQAANNDLFNPLVPKAHNSQNNQNLIFPLRIKPENINLKLIDDFYFCTLGTIGLTVFFYFSNLVLDEQFFFSHFSSPFILHPTPLAIIYGCGYTSLDISSLY